MPEKISLFNGQVVPLSSLSKLSIENFRSLIIERCKNGGRLISFFGTPDFSTLDKDSGNNSEKNESKVALIAIVTSEDYGKINVYLSEASDSYPAITPDCTQAHWFEREIAEQWGIKPLGHPWLKPIRFHASYRKKKDAWDRTNEKEILPCVTDFYKVNGDEIHEVAVGPVHAGVIEPGHFRFQCAGEKVLHLEISLGYQYRGIEKALVGGPDSRTWHYIQTLAGDTTIGHSLAYSELIEAFTGNKAFARAQSLRGIALELERLANHTGDLGALAGDVGFLPTASFCGRLRGDFLNLTALLCGNRFGRGMVRPGGVGFDVDSSRIKTLLDKLKITSSEVAGAIDLMWETPSVLARFENTGKLQSSVAKDLGLVGVAARACGIENDTRFDFPSGVYRFFQTPVSTWNDGDVFARAYVRWLEIQRSEKMITELAKSLPESQIFSDYEGLKPNMFGISLTEGWRGEICHAAFTDARGRFSWYKIVDPSFHNWMGLANSLRNQEISDFPLCNKSFNLSYCGHDL
ncbi:MAG: NADH-quinone oxidoreductase subunit C [Candidatus Riflebacteria bacterium]|nr:NADH-quinone oxidoreductase subunit C [Candidatus Riflebacteria bacterium]